MKTRNGKNRSRLAVIAAGLPLLVLAACTQSGSPTANATSTGNSQADASTDTDATLPKVPFGNRPCQSLSTEEQKDLKIAEPAPDKPTPGREPDDLAFDNTCDFGYQTLVYTTQEHYEYQKTNLRNPRHDPPSDVPGAFYDVLGNLWFAEKGYYVSIPNNTADAVKVKMARVIAAKL